MKENDEEIITNSNNNKNNNENEISPENKKFSIENEKISIDEISTKNNLKSSENFTNEESHSLLIPKTHRQTELSSDCFIGAEIASSELLSSIININLESTLNSILNPKKKFFKQLSIENIMSWQNNEINEPLLKMEKEMYEIPKQMFRNLLGYMLDRKSSKKPLSHARKFLKITMNNSNKIIKDEAYVQILKQLRNNKKYESLIRGLKFLAIISSVYVPTEKIYNLMLNYLFFQMQNNTDLNIVNHAKFIFVRMIKTKENERKNVPCKEELQFIESLKSILIPVYFFGGKSTIIKIESYNTINDLKNKLMEHLEFNKNKSIYYSIYEICSKLNETEERFIDDNENICDVISLWKNEIGKTKEKIEFKLYLKLLIYYSFDEDDYDTINMIYNQSLYDVLTGKFNIDENKIITLASLQILAEFGKDNENAYKSLKNNIEKYVPFNHLNKMRNIQWIEKIIEFYSNLSEFNQNQAKWNYLEELKNNVNYQMQQFDAKFNVNKSISNEDNIPEECVIGIKPDGINILDRERNEIVFYKYEIIMNWGISDNQFIICISNSDNEIRKICFFTSQTKTIQTLVEVYCNLIAGKTIIEIKEIINSNRQKFNKINTSNKRMGSCYYNKNKKENNNNKFLNDDFNNVNINDNNIDNRISNYGKEDFIQDDLNNNNNNININNNVN